MMFNTTFRICLIAACLVAAVHRAHAQTYRLTLEANENDVLIGMPVFITATLTNISRADQKRYKAMVDLRVFIRADNEDKYKLYEAGVYPKRRKEYHLMSIKPGESWDFREIILYQDRYDPYAGRPIRNESGLRLKDPGRYWIMAKYPGDGREIESNQIAIDVSEPISSLDRWVFDVLTCRDQESQRTGLSEQKRVQCMNKFFYLLHTGGDPFDVNVGHRDYRPEFVKTLWSLLEQGVSASRYGPAIKWALRRNSGYTHVFQKDQSLTKDQQRLIKDAPTFRRGTR